MIDVSENLRPHKDDEIDGIEYDEYGRMKFHPDFHPNHGKEFSQEDLEYLCMFYEFDNKRTIAFAKFYELKKKGLVDYYKNRFKRKLEA